MRARRCRECNQGTVRPLAAPGRVAPYKTFQALEVPNSLEIPTCDHCGAQWFDDDYAQRFDEAMEEVYRQKLLQRAQISLQVLSQAMTQKRLEELLGLSQGYLSKLRSGEKIPSAELVTHLALLALEPQRRLQELESFWSAQA